MIYLAWSCLTATVLAGFIAILWYTFEDKKELKMILLKMSIAALLICGFLSSVLYINKHESKKREPQQINQ